VAGSDLLSPDLSEGLENLLVTVCRSHVQSVALSTVVDKDSSVRGPSQSRPSRLGRLLKVDRLTLVNLYKGVLNIIGTAGGDRVTGSWLPGQKSGSPTGWGFGFRNAEGG
jgi:hypothetical protein